MASRPGTRSLEPIGAVGILVAVTLLVLWETGADASDVEPADWSHAAVGVVAYVVVAVAVVVLGTLRDNPVLTLIATAALVVFTTFQSFAVFAAIIPGAWLFVVLGPVFLGTGFLVDRARRRRGTSTPTPKEQSMNRGVTVAVVAAIQPGLVAVAVAPQISARVVGDTQPYALSPLDPIDPFRGAYVTLDYPDLAPDQSASAGGTGMGALDDGERGDVYVTLAQQDEDCVARDYSRERPATGDYLTCDDSDWQIRCGIESFFLPQDKAAATSRRSATGPWPRCGSTRVATPR